MAPDGIFEALGELFADAGDLVESSTSILESLPENPEVLTTASESITTNTSTTTSTSNSLAQLGADSFGGYHSKAKSENEDVESPEVL